MQNLSRSYSDLVSRCQRIANTRKEEIVIGSMPNLSAVITPRVCLAFHIRHPEVELRFREFFPSNFFQSLELGHFDVSVEYAAAYIHSSENVKFHKLAEVQHCCSFLPSHPLATKSVINFEDLRGERLMMYRRGITSCDDQLRDYIEKNEPDIEIVDIDIYDSTLQTRCAVEHAALLTYSGYSDSFTRFITVPANFNIPITLGVGWHRHCRPIVREFVDLALEMYPDFETQISEE